MRTTIKGNTFEITETESRFTGVSIVSGISVTTTIYGDDGRKVGPTVRRVASNVGAAISLGKATILTGLMGAVEND